MAEETHSNTNKQPAAEKAAKPAASKAAKAKKDKPPPIEKKPFPEFINQHYLPALEETLSAQGVQDLELSFSKQKLPAVGEDCWQIIGRWQNGQRQFSIGFPKEDITQTKVFAYASNGTQPSTIEPFLGDERKITLDLLVFYLVQRLNAQKWLDRN